MDEALPRDGGAHGPFTGPSLSATTAGAAIALGVLALLANGVLPALLGALNEEHRLSLRGIGLAVTGEALSMGVVNILAGVLLKPARLKLIGACAAIVLAGLDLAMTKASGPGVLLIRALSGGPEGVLLWITLGAVVARTATPARWVAVLFTSTTLAQFTVSAALAGVILPRFHSSGGFLLLAIMSLAGVIAAMLVPSQYAALPGGGHSVVGLPPSKGWVALAAVLIFVAGGGAVGIYLLPIAHQAGLGSTVGRLALSASLAGQVLGGVLASLVASRLHHLPVFITGVLVTLAIWTIYGGQPSAWLFIASTGVLGFFSIFMSPFLMPMTIAADPSRRAVVQCGAAQLFGGAIGPLLSSRVVGVHDIHRALYLGSGLLVTGTVVMVGLHFVGRGALDLSEAQPS